jgi:hypothetical protein
MGATIRLPRKVLELECAVVTGQCAIHLRANRSQDRRSSADASLEQTLEEEPLPGGTKRYIYDWSRDGDWLVHWDQSGNWLIPFPLSLHAESTRQKIFSDPAYQVYQTHISPDDRWIVFESIANSPNPESALYVVPALGGSTPGSTLNMILTVS